MKKYSVVFVMMLLASIPVAFAAAPAAVTQDSQSTSHSTSDGGPISTCRPGIPCDPVTQLKQVASDGGPISTCRPGIPCDPLDMAVFPAQPKANLLIVKLPVG